MKAQIFALKSQTALCREIQLLLEDYLYRRIEVELKIFDDDDPNQNASLEIGRAFFRLLGASMVRADDFSLEVESSLGEWGYWGYTGDSGKYFVRLGDRLRTKVFPSVAIMDRMVMVPEEIHDALDVPTGFSYLFRPLDLHGVLLVDFGDQIAIQEAIVKIGGELRKEIVGIGRRHIYVRRTRTPDLVDLSGVLHVSVDFLKELEGEIVKLVPTLSLDVTSGPVRLGTWSQVRLEVRNESGHELGIMRVQIRAPRNVMRAHFVQHLDFSSKELECQTLQLDVKPQVAPFCPLEVRFLSDDVAPIFTFPIPLILDVE